MLLVNFKRVLTSTLPWVLRGSSLREKKRRPKGKSSCLVSPDSPWFERRKARVLGGLKC